MSASKTVFRVKNWSAYNTILKDRWSLDLWLSEDVVKHWYETRPRKRKGASLTYSKDAILACLTIRALFNLSLRATEGFIKSLFQRLHLPLRCPSYTQLCRRMDAFKKLPLPRLAKGCAFYGILDATGLKVYGEGEWHVKMHQASRRRTWRKLHVAIDPVTQELLAAVLTESTRHESTLLAEILNAIKDPLKKLWADGAYDTSAVYNTLYQRGIRPVIPPRTGARAAGLRYTKPYLGRRRLVCKQPHLLPRDVAIQFIDQFPNSAEGRRIWKQSIGYGLRSLVETAMMRFKRIFTDKLRSRRLSSQKAEVKIKARILNKMLHLGFPHTVPVPSSAL